MLKVLGINSYMKKSKLQQAQIKSGAADFVRGQTKKILRDLVLNTPQWSGNTAASWQVQVTGADISYYPTSLHVEDWKDVDPTKFKGDTEAWREALKNAQPALKAIRYNKKVSIINTADYADELATLSETELKLRKGNYIEGDVMATKLAAAKYKLSSNVVGLGLKRDFNYE